jgi:glycosyltransferase involved in cell wall biosynthesis
MLIPRAAAVITVSPPIARHLERVYHLRSVAIVANYPVVQPVTAKDLRSLPGGDQIPASAPIVLYIGLIQPGRGIEQLVAAIVQVPPAHLVFLGGGSTTSEIRTLAERLGIGGRLHYLGPVPSDDVIDFAASATVGVSAAIPTSLSFEYSLPNKLFQYLAAGLPVVASDFEHVRSVVAANEAGLNVDMREPDRIAGALLEILEDRKRADQMGRNARSAVVNTYNWGNAARELMSTYAEVAQRVAK